MRDKTVSSQMPALIDSTIQRAISTPPCGTIPSDETQPVRPKIRTMTGVIKRRTAERTAATRMSHSRERGFCTTRATYPTNAVSERHRLNAKITHSSAILIAYKGGWPILGVVDSIRRYTDSPENIANSASMQAVCHVGAIEYRPRKSPPREPMGGQYIFRPTQLARAPNFAPNLVNCRNQAITLIDPCQPFSMSVMAMFQ